MRVNVRLDGRSLTIDDLIAAAAGRAEVTADPAAVALVDERHAQLLEARARGAVYGANTGVGANRHERTDSADEGSHGLRLLRSHCAGAGPVEDDLTARATMVTRLNQILAGGSGISGRVAAALLAALRDGAVPTLHSWGAIGTADLAALAELGLTLAGERPWRSGHGPVTTPAYLATQRSVLLEWTSAVAEAVAKGWSREETIARVDFRDKFGPVDVGQGYMMDHIQTLNAASLWDKFTAKRAPVR